MRARTSSCSLMKLTEPRRAGWATTCARKRTMSALRSLFHISKNTGRTFRNPASGINGGTPAPGLLIPLDQAAYDRAIQAATKPPARLMLALAAMHAARPHAIRHLPLTDIDLGGGRITLNGHTRPLDPITRAVVLEYLAHRRTRWPGTANPHLLVTRSTASGCNPSSHTWIKKQFTGLTATIEHMRTDRQLEEALSAGPDPLHLAAVFGISHQTAIRYAHAARQLLAEPTAVPAEPRAVAAAGPGPALAGRREA